MCKRIVVALVGVLVLACAVVGGDRLVNARTFQLGGDLVHRVETGEKVVALTFDDGPTDKTESVLNVLREHQVKATFFLVGSDLHERPALGKKIVADDHQVGNHSYTHSRMVFTGSDAVASEIERTDAELRAAGYQGDIHFRPPYGKKLWTLPRYLAEHHRTTIMWDVEPETDPDIAGNADAIVRNVVESVRPGSIVLLHPMNEYNKATVSALPRLIGELRGQGYRFVTVDELLRLR